MASLRQSTNRAYNAPRLSPSPSTFPLDTDQDALPTASNKAILSSLECINDYIQKHYDRFVAQESLKRSRLAASFVEKEQSYQRQIATLKAVHVDIAGLLSREQETSADLRQKLDNSASSLARLCKVVTDANFEFVDRKRPPLEIKQEESSQEITSVPDVAICPDAAVSAILTQIETVVTEMNAQNGVSLPSPVDASPCCSVIDSLRKVVDSLSATQHTFALLQENSKSVNAARADAELQNESLQEKIALLQEELKQAKGDNERISQELAAVRLEREEHVCRPPASSYPTPAAKDNFDGFSVSLPSPPLEKRDLPVPDDALQGTSKICRRTNQTLPKLVLPENAPPLLQTPVAEAGPSSAPTSATGERRRISLSDAIKRVQANPTSSAVQSGPSKPPAVRDDKLTAGPSMPPPPSPAPVQGIKRTSSGGQKYQNPSQGPPSSLSTSTSVTSPISDKTNNLHTQKKRRISGTPSTPTNQKHKPPSEAPSKTASTTHTSTSTTGPSSASPSKHAATQLPKTNSSDLKCLKFNKKPPLGKLPSTPAVTKPRPIVTPTKSDRPMRPLDLAKKSPQERAALRRFK